jgi:hypothetical protein
MKEIKISENKREEEKRRIPKRNKERSRAIEKLRN